MATASNDLVGKLSWMIASPIASAVIGYGLKRLIDWLTREGRWKTLVYCVLLAAASLAWLALAGLGARWWLDPTPLSALDQQVLFFAVLSQLVVGYLLFCLARRDIKGRTAHTVQTHPGAFLVKVEKKDRRGNVSVNNISVRRLNVKGLGKDKKLMLTRRTFCEGVEFIVDQIRAHNPQVAPSLCVGINLSGAAMASLVAEALSPAVPIPLGFVSAVNPDHVVDEKRSSLPGVDDPGLILIFDKEVKTGAVVQNATKFLRDKYGPTPTIMTAVLVACRVPKPIEHMRNLLKGGDRKAGVFDKAEEYLPDFLAFTCWNSINLDRRH